MGKKKNGVEKRNGGLEKTFSRHVRTFKDGREPYEEFEEIKGEY